MMKTVIYTMLYFFFFCMTFAPRYLVSQDRDLGFIFGGLAWSPDGERLAVGASQGVWIFDIDDSGAIDHFDSPIYVTSLAWSPDGTMIAASGTERVIRDDDTPRRGAVQIWNVVTARELIVFRQHERTPISLSWSPDGRYIASGGYDATFYIWEARTGSILSMLPSSGIAYEATWSPDGSQIATANGDGLVTIWDSNSGETHMNFDDISSLAAIAWQPNGDVLAVATYVDEVTLWDTTSEELLATLPGNGNPVWAVDWSPDGRKLATGNWDSIRIWDVETEVMLTEITEAVFGRDGHYNNSLVWSPDGSELASVSDDGHVYVWDAKTYQTTLVIDGFTPLIGLDEISTPIPRPTATPES